jgi:hypothetical protein
MAADAVVKTLRHSWKALESAGCQPVLMGGLAVSLWKHLRFTRDVDLLIGLEGTDLQRVVTTLQREGLRPKHHPLVIELGTTRIAQFLYDPPGAFLTLQVDLLLAESEYQKTAVSRRVPAQMPGLDLDIFMLSCEDLILHKLIGGRIIDRADAAAILRLNRTTINLKYLADWIPKLSVGQEWAEIWQEAFPGEPVPTG